MKNKKTPKLSFGAQVFLNLLSESTVRGFLLTELSRGDALTYIETDMDGETGYSECGLWNIDRRTEHLSKKAARAWHENAVARLCCEGWRIISKEKSAEAESDQRVMP